MRVDPIRTIWAAVGRVCLSLHRVPATIRRSLRDGRSHTTGAFSYYKRGAENVCSANQPREDNGVLVLCRLRDSSVSCSWWCSLPEPQYQAGHTGRYLMACADNSFLDAQRAEVGAYP